MGNDHKWFAIMDEPVVQKVLARSPNASKNSDGQVKKCSY